MRMFESVFLLFFVSPLAAFTLSPDFIPECYARCRSEVVSQAAAHADWSIVYGAITGASVNGECDVDADQQCFQKEPCQATVNCTVTILQPQAQSRVVEDWTAGVFPAPRVMDNQNTALCPKSKVYTFNVTFCGDKEVKDLALGVGACIGGGITGAVLDQKRIGLKCDACPDSN